MASGQGVYCNIPTIGNVLLPVAVTDILAHRPVADGTKGFYYAGGVMYFDAGTWVEIGTPVLNASTLATGGTGTGSNPFTGWDTAINWSLGNQVVYFPMLNNQQTYYAASSGISVTGFRTWLVGDGENGSMLRWTGAAGTFWTFTASGVEYAEGGMSQLGFAATDTTSTKVFCKLVDCELMTFERISAIAGSWTGSTSIGFQVQGRETLRWDKCIIYADIPFQIEPDPNVSTECFDHSSVKRSVLICNSATVGACINVITGVNLTNSTFEDVALVQGQYGFRYVDSTAGVNAYVVTIQNMRWEQSNTGAGSFAISIEMSGAAKLQGLSIRNLIVGGTSTATGGIKLRQIVSGTIDNVTYYPPAGVFLDADNSNGPVTFIGGLRSTGSTVSLGTTFQYIATAGDIVGSVIQAGAALTTNGSVATRFAAITLSNGLNSDIAMPSNTYVRATGPTLPFSIGGFTGGIDGRQLYFYSTVSQTMTVVNQDASSTAANRILTLTGANVIMVGASPSFASFIYDATQSRWILTSYNAG